MHGGKFELKSKLRQGTEVIVTLPRTRTMNFATDTTQTEREQAKDQRSHRKSA